MYAEKWLEQNAPEIHAAAPEHVAMTSVLKLIQLERMSEVAVLELAPKVFDGSATRLEIKKRIEKAKLETDQSAGVGHDRWHKTREYEEFVTRYLERNIGILSQGQDAEFRPSGQIKAGSL